MTPEQSKSEYYGWEIGTSMFLKILGNPNMQISLGITALGILKKSFRAFTGTLEFFFSFFGGFLVRV